MNDSSDLPSYEEIAAMSEVDLFKLIAEKLDNEASYIRTVQEIHQRHYGSSDWMPAAACRHHVLCAISGLLGKWAAAVEKGPNPFFTRSRDILRDGILDEMRLLDPTIGAEK